ncbi:MAG TPA: cohesin domain-containing protein [Burkholderiales bacterium]|nr:cohesin domain-containing protein [Burkholderiales bacterium]
MRRFMLLGALVAIVGYPLLDESAIGGGLAVAQTERAETRGAAKTTPAERLELPERRGLSRTQGELFGAPPPPAPAPGAKKAAPAPVVVSAPVAPPVPYRFAGKVRKGSEEEVLISKGDVVVPVKAGDTLDGVYKVESISAERIDLVYLPLGTRDRIVVSSALDAEGAQPPLAAAPAPAPAPAAASASGATSVGPAQLRWEGPERVAAGESFTVTLRVSTTEPLRAAPMQLRFAPDVLQPVNVRPGKFFGQGSFTYRVNPEGSIFVGASSPAAAAGNDAELVVVTFRPIKSGTTAELSMGALSLQGASGRAIAHEQLGTFRTAIQ